MRFLEDTYDENLIEWFVSYTFDTLEYDDELESNEVTQVIEAEDFATAVKYAEQYMRAQAKEDPKWSTASIEAIYKR